MRVLHVACLEGLILYVFKTCFCRGLGEHENVRYVKMISMFFNLNATCCFLAMYFALSSIYLAVEHLGQCLFSAFGSSYNLPQTNWRNRRSMNIHFKLSSWSVPMVFSCLFSFVHTCMICFISLKHLQVAIFHVSGDDFNLRSCQMRTVYLWCYCLFKAKLKCTWKQTKTRKNTDTIVLPPRKKQTFSLLQYEWQRRRCLC